MRQVKQFKIRCSAIGQIMGGNMGLTEKQGNLLDVLEEKHNNPKEIPMSDGKVKKLNTLTEKVASGKELTAKQASDLADLEHLRDNPKFESLTDKQMETMQQLKHIEDNPELPTGAKTYCKKWLITQLTGKKKIVSTKEMAKGNLNEEESLKMIAKKLGRIIIKNEEHYVGDYMTGTPDVALSSLVVDAKNSYEADTFPLFETDLPNKDYYWQMQGYMNLTDTPKSIVAYCLTNTPFHLIESAVRREAYNNGMLEATEEMENEYYQNMTYDDVDDELKIKLFPVERDNQAIQSIITRVKACRKYISQLLQNHKQCQIAQ